MHKIIIKMNFYFSNTDSFGLEKNPNTMYATTILCIKKNGKVVMCGDGQVTLGHTIVKSTAKKIRKLEKHNVLVGFAGSAADGFALAERLEGKLEKHPMQLTRACIELAKDWRNDKVLRKLEAMLIVANTEEILTISGNGDVMEPEYGITSIGSGGNYALSAALALSNNTDMDIIEIAKKSMEIAGSICIYSNKNLTIEVLG
jgi:ATP-dependent HslUV protease subunit HslV